MNLRAVRGLGSGRLAWVAALTLAFVSVASRADARARGIVVDGCNGCHGGGSVEVPQLSLTADPATFKPGDSVTMSLSIRWPSIHDAGVYVWTPGVGTFQALSGEGLAVNGQGLTHTTPKTATNGTVSFRFGWRAPATPGAVDFGVAVVAGNGNNASSGDSPGFQAFSWVYGCTGRTIFVDLDRDGYGSKQLGTKMICADDPVPAGYGAMDGDCDENDEKSHPGATEVCNKKDDNCDGQVDEGASPVSMWPDADGDGFYASQSGTAKLGCGNVPGYAAVGGDCNDLDAAINPGKQEICNNKDDNCDGDIDERVRPQCGVGWCARYSASCDPSDCQPGPPRAETCNSFDDDCDGLVDNEACSGDLVCSSGQCVSSGTPMEIPQGTAGTSGVMPPPIPTAGSSASAGSAGSASTPPVMDSKGSGSGCQVTSGLVPRGGQWLAAAALGAVGLLARGGRNRRRRVQTFRLRRP